MCACLPTPFLCLTCFGHWKLSEIIPWEAQEGLDPFDVQKNRQATKVADSAQRKDLKVYDFEPEQIGIVTVTDISDLNLSSDNYWGGLAGFSTKANDVVAKVVTRSHGTWCLNEAPASQFRVKSQ